MTSIIRYYLLLMILIDNVV